MNPDCGCWSGGPAFCRDRSRTRLSLNVRRGGDLVDFGTGEDAWEKGPWHRSFASLRGAVCVYFWVLDEQVDCAVFDIAEVFEIVFDLKM